MTRRPNITTGRAPLAIGLTFTATEFGYLQFNTPGPSGDMGGLQKKENWVIENTDPSTGVCIFDPERFMRLIIYLKSYGDGGPNGRLRACCFPALKRIGIPVREGWGTQKGPNPNREQE